MNWDCHPNSTACKDSSGNEKSRVELKQIVCSGRGSGTPFWLHLRNKPVDKKHQLFRLNQERFSGQKPLELDQVVETIQVESFPQGFPLRAMSAEFLNCFLVNAIRSPVDPVEHERLQC
jgi:hypothetical protein